MVPSSASSHRPLTSDATAGETTDGDVTSALLVSLLISECLPPATAISPFKTSVALLLSAFVGTEASVLRLLGRRYQKVTTTMQQMKKTDVMPKESSCIPLMGDVSVLAMVYIPICHVKTDPVGRGLHGVSRVLSESIHQIPNPKYVFANWSSSDYHLISVCPGPSTRCYEPGVKALPMNTTSTAAKLIFISVSTFFGKLIRVTYVAVAAKISILLAELKAASMPANSAVKPAAIPIRP
jgi:hypothetical protein